MSQGRQRFVCRLFVFIFIFVFVYFYYILRQATFYLPADRACMPRAGDGVGVREGHT
jgi:hypothetical protein